jgi:hypothetical protein
MAPLRGWSACDTRLKGSAPFGHWNTITFLAALRHDRIDAPWMIDGSINGDRFRVYVEQVPAPILAPGDIVVMDNLGSHKGKAVRRAIRQANAKLLFLPQYSPGPQSDRTILRQAQVSPQGRPTTDLQNPQRCHRRSSRSSHASGMLKLP